MSVSLSFSKATNAADCFDLTVHLFTNYFYTIWKLRKAGSDNYIYNIYIYIYILKCLIVLAEEFHLRLIYCAAKYNIFKVKSNIPNTCAKVMYARVCIKSYYKFIIN